MTGAWAALLAFQGLVFLAWALLMVRTLVLLRRHAVAESGHSIPGIGATWRSWRMVLTAAAWRRERRLLGGLTAALLLMAAAGPLLHPAPVASPGQGVAPPPPRH